VAATRDSASGYWLGSLIGPGVYSEARPAGFYGRDLDTVLWDSKRKNNHLTKKTVYFRGARKGHQPEPKPKRINRIVISKLGGGECGRE